MEAVDGVLFLKAATRGPPTGRFSKLSIHANQGSKFVGVRTIDG
jgi:hypothetical protein